MREYLILMSVTCPLPSPEPKHKRGKLASLMSEEAKATASIHELSYDFAYLNARSLPPDNIGKAANLE